ncbi:MAG: histidine--tRNA ligase [Myxococcales bacterium]|nr:histidine--tRNA ligase [Myxococcales bacterium]
MPSTKPPSGMRDFLPEELRRRRYLFEMIERAYRRHGFEPIQTPALERIETLTGKYGDEGEQLMYKALKRGQKLLDAIDAGELQPNDLADMGLRYDQTVPLSRVVAQYRNDLPRIFKCYQISPVWRADRPAKGRFREFYQCDVDVVGTDSVLVEVDVLTAAAEALSDLGISDFTIRINERNLLYAMTNAAGIPLELAQSALVALDKLDKIGAEAVIGEMVSHGISSESGARLMEIASAAEAAGSAMEGLELVFEAVGDDYSEANRSRTTKLFELLAASGLAAERVVFDPYLARGLSYYTGPIYEFSIPGFPGSSGGGGRYDGLIGMFTGDDIPACGVSLGVERLYMIMEERGLFPDHLDSGCDVFITQFDDQAAEAGLQAALTLRKAGYSVDVYPESPRLKKQFQQAERAKAKVVIVAGPDERANGQVVLKDMKTGQQTTVSVEAIVDGVHQILGSS